MLERIETPAAFVAMVEEVEQTTGYRKPLAWAIGKVVYGQVNTDTVLKVDFPFINWDQNFGSFAAMYKAFGGFSCEDSELSLPLTSNETNVLNNIFSPFLEEAVGDVHVNVQVIKILNSMSKPVDATDGLSMILPLVDAETYRLIAIFEDDEVKTPEVAYLKLMALSANIVPLRSLNLSGVFGVLKNVAWVGTFPLELEYLRTYEMKLKLTGQYPKIDYVDKFPRYLDHVIPADNVRILDTSKVRFGAQLAGGTTVMPGAAYINFNSGTEGPVMVEGRISSSVKVGAGSDIGGGASILGVLSGGNTTPITIGKNTLLGANSVCGVSLGDNCILDAGCTILAGTKVVILAGELEKIQEVNPDHYYTVERFKTPQDMESTGKLISGMNGVHIRQDSTTGKITVFRSIRSIELNPDLH